MDNQQKRLAAKGFTLFELLIVITIMTMVMALASNSIFSSISAYRLAAAGGQLESDITYGVQLASKLNHPVEMRFYRSSGFDPQVIGEFNSYQFLKREASTGAVIPISRVIEIEPGIVVHQSLTYSSLFAIREKTAVSHDPEIFLGSAMTRLYSYLGIQFRPDGTTSLTKDKIWCLTLVPEGRSQTELPRNFRTLVINAVNGSVTAY